MQTTVMIGRRIAKSDMNTFFLVLATGRTQGGEEQFAIRVAQACFIDAEGRDGVCGLLPDALKHKC
jgi:hypothetical protein